MKKLITFLFFIWLSPLVMASSGAHLMSPNIDVSDQESLQRGAKTFVNYCMGCHAMGYMRYNRMGKDLGLSEQEVTDNLIFNGSKVGGLMTIAMPKDDAKKWFGTVPPDLTLAARNRGEDWLYTYLKSFYVDEKKPMGINNIVFKDVGMPHVLAGLQGKQKAVFKEEQDGDIKHKVFEKFESLSTGTLDKDPKVNAEKYDRVVTDLVNFLSYAGEPTQLERRSLGIKVILFLIIFMVVAYLLKKEYWKDIH